MIQAKAKIPKIAIPIPMPAPKPALNASEALTGRSMVVKILGRKHRNGEPFVENFEMDIMKCGKDVNFKDLLAHAYAGAEKQTEIPLDLIEGFELRFQPSEH
jgi:hypothetical protein